MVARVSAHGPLCKDGVPCGFGQVGGHLASIGVGQVGVRSDRREKELAGEGAGLKHVWVVLGKWRRIFCTV